MLVIYLFLIGNVRIFLKKYFKKSRMILYLTFCRKNTKIKNLRKVYYYDKKNSKNDEKNKSLQTGNK